MRIFERRYLFVLGLALAVILAGCESTEKKHVSTAPPPAAKAPTLTAVMPPAPEQKIEEKVAPKPDPVEEMLRAVEREYEAGRANYTSGHLEAAKDAFNRAFELLLKGPVNVHSDPRLEAEFDKVVDGVHSLEMVALKEGDGFTEQMAQPAPIDEANDVTFPVDPKIKALAAAEIKETHSDLPLVLNDEVASYINYYSSSRGHGVLERALTRAGRYRDMISRVLKEEGVPQDLIYLAEAESGFVPVALSRAGARGMWQFIASRGVAYGLRHDWWVDDRQDPEKSTRAAAKHLKDLYTQFGDWYLAMAAYNSGPGTVQAAVQRTGYADFWELYRRRVLPQETKNYVPIILAVTIMAKNPAQYGLENIQPDAPALSDTVRINYPVDLRLVAECVDSSVSNLQELNPSLLRMTTPKTGDFDLHLPAGTKDKFTAAIAEIPSDMRVWWRYHKVTDGDTMASLARQYHTTAKAITEVNNLGAADELPRDAKLIIPITPGQLKEGADVAYSKSVVRYKVRQGDTVLSVADEWGVAPEMVRKWNKLRGNDLRRGRILFIHRPVTDTARVSGGSTKRSSSRKSSSGKGLQASNKAPAKRVTHTVKKGETLSSIASRYNTSVTALRRDNSRAAAHLKPGDVLVISSVR
jgi:peptidoglycan lytic transglycosylase D